MEAHLNPPNPYPFPSNINIVSSVTLKLNDSNYLLWKTQFESLLSSQRLLGFVNGGVVSTAANAPEYENWFYTDQLIRSWIFGTLSEEVLGYVHNIASSREIWSSLAENFNKSYVAREFSLRRSLQLHNKSGKTLSTYYREFKNICDSLSSIGKPVEETIKIFGFLNGLGREYDPITTVIQSSLSKVPPPTFNDVISDVEGFDVKLQSYEDSNTVNPHMAFQTQPTYYNRYNNNTPPWYQQDHRSRGHSGSNRGRSGYSTRGRGFSQHQTPSSNTDNRPICQICGRIGHSAIKCYNRYDNNHQGGDAPQVFSALQVADDSGQDWYPDSGASTHVTASKSNLTTSTSYNGNEAIMVADGNTLPITHVGSTIISSSTESGGKGTSK